jgi:hypothetical protein
MPQPEIYTKGFTLENPSFFSIMAQNIAAGNPFTMVPIYLFNLLALILITYIFFRIFGHIFINNTVESENPKQLSFSRPLIGLFIISMLFFVLSPVYSIGRINSKAIIGNEIIIGDAPTTIAANIFGLIVFLIISFFIVQHLHRKKNSIRDIFTHLLPIPLVLFYLYMFISGYRFPLNQFIMLAIAALACIWLFVSFKKNFRAIEIKTITVVIFLIFSYVGFYLYNFIYTSFIIHGPVFSEFTWNLDSFNFILELFKLVVYIGFHWYLFRAFIIELHENNEFGFHKYHIWVLDNAEIKEFVHQSKFTLSQKGRFEKQTKDIHLHLTNGILKICEEIAKKKKDKDYSISCSPKHILTYLIGHSYDINLINYIISSRSQFRKYYEKAAQEITTDIVHEVIVDKRSYLVARILKNMHLNKKFIINHISDSTEIKPEIKRSIIDNYLKYESMYDVLNHSKGSSEMKRYIKKLLPLINYFNVKSDSKHYIVRGIRKLEKQGWKIDDIKNAIILSHIKTEILIDKGIDSMLHK